MKIKKCLKMNFKNTYHYSNLVTCLTDIFAEYLLYRRLIFEEVLGGFAMPNL